MVSTKKWKMLTKQEANYRGERPKKSSPEQMQLALSLLEQGKTYRQVTAMTEISKGTLVRARR